MRLCRNRGTSVDRPGQVVHVRNAMMGITKQAVTCALIEASPADRGEPREEGALPEMRMVRKEREVLTDEVIARFSTCDATRSGHLTDEQ